MAYKFNPFTGKLDETGSGGATAAGSANEIQYNDGAGGLAASSDFTVDPDWNDAVVTFTGLKLNITDTASAATSNLLDLQVNGSSSLKVTKDGSIRYTETTNDLQGIEKVSLYNQSNSHAVKVNNYGVWLFAGTASTEVVALKIDGASGTPVFREKFSFASNPNISSGDVAIARDSAGVVKVTDNSTGTGYIKQVPVLTANLPNAATVDAGTRGFVSDAGALTFNTPIGTGTGTPSANTTIPVFSDGSVWKAG